MKCNFIYAVIIFFISISCKKETSLKEIQSNSKKINVEYVETKRKLDCGDMIYQIVKSSDLNLKDYKDEYFVRIEEILNDSVRIKVYVENNLSDNPSQKQIVESTIARLLFLPNKKEIWDVTADPEHPTIVKFKFNDFESVFKLCDISQKEVVDELQIGKNPKSIDCKTITVEMGKGEECLFKNANIEDVYSSIIRDKEVDDYQYLLKLIPKNDKSILINKNGLISIEYKVNKDKVEIKFSYDGGLTVVNIENDNNDVKRTIIYYVN
ncbi:hypothetical protein [Flavobacterium johnsoniae]|uniref:Lipoprotein n=1 Tax=Flavobacterium johnsoniae TaxID=986 RepID=A0A1M5UDU3_FLAJO|nr:hypothetical protein [Flavobacterium johnsoniae]SHH61235.1 hypothetical protein SAMN05444388_113117 [Flavobacterium johnsoniae]